MLVLSFDVGIKNMAYCLIEYNDKIVIKDWQLVDNARIPPCHLCNKCAKTYVFKTPEKTLEKCDYFCDTHTKNYAEKHYIKRGEIKKVKDCNLMDLEYLATNLYNYLEAKPHLWTNIDYIIIEQQPPKATDKVKQMEMMLYSYFLNKQILQKTGIVNLRRYQARKKLEILGMENLPEFNKYDKSEYKDRKALSKLYTNLILKKIEDYKYLQILSDIKKTDDLCDAFVQGLETIQSILNKNLF
jgi:hypothetical protein